jgi:D-alanyl-D-alanine carboxypeptidase
VNKWPAVFVVGVVAATGALLRAQPQPPPEPPAVSMAASLQEALDEWAAQPGHHGVSASVILANRAQWSGAAGRASLDEPLTPDHRLAMASITKTMTGAVVLTLVDDGVVQLDDPIDRWLEPLRNIPGSITVRQLLNHTNGLANYPDSVALQRAVTADFSKVFTASEVLSYVGPPVAPPGVRTQYTNTAFLVLGLIAERASGRTMVELYRQRLWTPLGLQEIFFPGFEEPSEPIALVLGTSGLFPPMTRISQLTTGNTAGGLFATARDVATWGHALFTGPLLLPHTQEQMRQLEPAAGNIPGESGAGLGIRGYGYFDRIQYGHSGGGGFGNSLMLHDPETGITVVVMMNQALNTQHFELAPRLLQIASS